jgi:hypothetical protein
MPKLLYCIWGQIRAASTAGPSQRRWLYDGNDTDLVICCNCPSEDDIEAVRTSCSYYGPTLDTHVYSVPTHCIKKGLGVAVEFCRGKHKKPEFTDIARPGAVSRNNIFLPGSFQILHNSVVLRSRLSGLDLSPYTHVIIMRSDMVYMQPMLDVGLLTPDTIYTFAGEGSGRWFRGLHLTPTIVPIQLLDAFMYAHSTHIYHDVDCRVTAKNCRNIEETIKFFMWKKELTVRHIRCNTSFITWDTQSPRTSLCVTDRHTGLRYKYRPLFISTLQTSGLQLHYTNENSVIGVTTNCAKCGYSSQLGDDGHPMQPHVCGACEKGMFES